MRSDRIAIHWAREGSEAARGNKTGYSLANMRLKAALAPLVEFRDDAPIAVHFTSPDYHRPIPGKFNVLFSMVEREEQVEEYGKGLADCDLLVTCSRFCLDIFRRKLTAPVALCPLGVDSRVFTPRRRYLRPGERFRWLYVGSPSYRKLTIVPGLYDAFLSKLRNVELYLKTQGNLLGSELEAVLKSGAAQEVSPGVFVGGNATLDTRFLPESEIVNLMHSAHGGLLLTACEGFGATGLEMMATGLPLVVSAYSGPRDYSDKSNSFPVVCAPQSMDVFSVTPEGTEDGPPSRVTLMYPDPVDACRQMTTVMHDYSKASRVGMAGASTARQFSWSQSARKLHSILLDSWYSHKSGPSVSLAS